ncbi:uncharacterized protein LOC131525172 [Onychostoma macrolepis]|uniref:uncharacterized protein LOC131525172 n=1 Tax=Onychostoma macrolepis TaxID=369639 RepID=UPI00272BE2EB|nr:uncharacterized protein LOC131525172 [Onychostoma macrolepis]
MVHSCCVVDCTARWGPDKKFFRISSEKDREKRKKWLRAIRRLNLDAPKKAWIPAASDRVCEAHFVHGVPNRDPQHPDYVPHIKMGYSGSQNLKAKEKSVQRYERRIKRQRLPSAMPSTSTSATVPDLGGHDDVSMDCEVIVSVDPDPTSADNEMTTETSASCSDQAAKKEQLEAETKRLAEELLAQQRAAVYYNEKSTKLQEALNKEEFTVNNLSEKQLKYYTGLRSRKLFDWIVKVVSARQLPYFCEKLSITDKVLLLLMKLRLGLQNKDLAYRFKISADQVTKIVNIGSSVMADALKFLIVWPEKGAIIRNLPKAFKKTRRYKKTCVIIDCRAVCFLSKCWGGRVSDKELTINSGFLEQLEHGDQVMADRGFLIREELLCRGGSLVIPAFTKGKNQLSHKEVIDSRKTANVRIHVERAIGRMKKFRILKTTWELRLVKSADNIVTIIAALVNLLPPQVK